ncbi:MAG: CpaF family protein [Nitrospinae bacterium]|nr:CpaF family protein [Nitrospinota bacterium]
MALFDYKASTVVKTPPKPIFLMQKRSEKYLHGSEYQELKARMHDRLLDRLDFAVVDTLDRSVLRQEISKLVEQLLESELVPLNFQERERLIREVQDEVLGLGPLEPFLQDPKVSDILVNTHKQIYVERMGKLELTEARFKDDVHLRKIIDRIVSNVGRRIDESSPMVDARLPDGSRVNAIIPPLAIDGPILSIRRFAVDPLKLDDLIGLKTLTPEVGELLQGIVRARLNVLISGGTGSGKTTLLNVLSGFVPSAERIVTIEDSAELQLQQEHVVRLETRPPNIEGKGQVTQRDLVRNSLRMRPDRIIVGEVRGDEALDMLQAMNTGHDGSLTTIHANSPRDALVRVETMVSMAGVNIPTRFLRHYISSALDIIIQVARLTDGSRKLTSLQEATGMEGDIINLQEIFAFEQTGIDANGSVKGRFKATGIRPRFVEKFKARGILIPHDLFDPRKGYEV